MILLDIHGNTHILNSTYYKASMFDFQGTTLIELKTVSDGAFYIYYSENDKNISFTTNGTGKYYLMRNGFTGVLCVPLMSALIELAECADCTIQEMFSQIVESLNKGEL